MVKERSQVEESNFGAVAKGGGGARGRVLVVSKGGAISKF